MQDLIAATVEVTVREDGKVVWVNTEEGCVARISGVRQVVLVDDRSDSLTELQQAAQFAASVLRSQGLYDVSERLAFHKLQKALARAE